MADIVERLKFDAARCEVDYSKGVAGNIEEAAAEIERLRAALGDILGVAQTSKIIDKRGRAVSSCDTTCLNECAEIALDALGNEQEGSVK